MNLDYGSMVAASFRARDLARDVTLTDAVHAGIAARQGRDAPSRPPSQPRWAHILILDQGRQPEQDLCRVRQDLMHFCRDVHEIPERGRIATLAET